MYEVWVLFWYEWMRYRVRVYLMLIYWWWWWGFSFFVLFGRCVQALHWQRCLKNNYVVLRGLFGKLALARGRIEQVYKKTIGRIVTMGSKVLFLQYFPSARFRQILNYLTRTITWPNPPVYWDFTILTFQGRITFSNMNGRIGY